MVKNAYIHIPFCKSKCKYCSFVSFETLGQIDQYVAALLLEIKHYYKGEELETLYFGGGTPSLLSLKHFEAIINSFNFAKDYELTVEVNPDSVSCDFLRGLRALGVNRLSMGAQTFDDCILKDIGRRHCAFEIELAVRLARCAGFKNISLDLMYGLPNQKCGDFMADIQHAVDLGVEHVSLYGLKIENDWTPKNLPTDDNQADMYNSAMKTMARNGFKHYEISNFCVNSAFESRHNMNYWNNNTYYGFGPAAHGYVNGIRYANVSNLEEYMFFPLDRKKEHKLSNIEKLEEEIFLGFRRCSGVDADLINKKYGIDFEKKYAKVLRKFINSGHIEHVEKKYALTEKGILLSNIVLSEFLED